jgi:hypothetical protein
LLDIPPNPYRKSSTGSADSTSSVSKLSLLVQALVARQPKPSHHIQLLKAVKVAHKDAQHVTGDSQRLVAHDQVLVQCQPKSHTSHLMHSSSSNNNNRASTSHTVNFNPHVEVFPQTQSIKWTAHVEVFIIPARDLSPRDYDLVCKEDEDERIDTLSPYARCPEPPYEASMALETKHDTDGYAVSMEGAPVIK